VAVGSIVEEFDEIELGVSTLRPFGTPIWYLASGPIIDDTFTAVLEKHVGGQCVSCVYKRPAYNGDDGIISIRLHSRTSATMTLPGGRTTDVVPQEF
jgi:hypothetical protein